MTAWRWLKPEAVRQMHLDQLAEHGGLAGVRDLGLLDSALARPLNLAAYGGNDVDLAALAAAYAFGIARNHPFPDGNKRTAAVACESFIMINAGWLEADEASFCVITKQMAAGELDEQGVADWLREHIIARPG